MPPGRLNIKLLLLLLVVGVGVVAAIKLVPPYWRYLSLQDPVKEAAVAAVSRPGGEPAAQEELIQRAAALGLTLGEEHIEFIRDGSRLTLRVRWSETVELPGYRTTIPFKIEHRVPAP
jgi:hypothetical protein